MKIALVGNQNSGKTTLFNLLPGIYSLSPYSIEEELSRKFIFEEKPDVIVNIIDSTSLERSLYLTTQLLEMDCKVIIALNMVDLLEKKGFYVDENRLEKILGAKVIKISALKGTGNRKQSKK